MKRMIVVDLDGTLLNKEKQYDFLTTEYLKKLKEEGYIIVIATGRILPSALKVTDNAYFANFIIASSGTLIYEVESHKVLRKSTLNDHILKLIGKLSTSFKQVDFFSEKILYSIGAQTASTFYEQRIPAKQIASLTDITQIALYLHQDKWIESYKQILSKYMPDVSIRTMQDSKKTYRWLFITNQNQNKYTMIKILAEKNNIELTDIIAFGDGLNDLEMLSKLPVSVAMGNALEEVKKVAKYQTTSNEEHGILKFLENYLKM